MKIFASGRLSRLALASSVALIGAGLGCKSSGTTGTGGHAATGSTTGAGGSNACTGSNCLVAPDNTWTWVDVPESRCMTDTPTGIGINLNSKSKDVIIYLEGGNACFNTLSCAVTFNKNGYDSTAFQKDVDGSSGNMNLTTWPAFQRTDPNPLKDYNYIYVPYCSGDLHAGDVSGVMVGGKTRNFHGFKNMTAYLQRITATFPHPGKVILAGFSAGGFGAALNYDQTAKAFGPDVKVTLIDDSGPPLTGMAPGGDNYIAACLQKAFNDTWNLSANFPAACTDCKPANGVFTEGLARYLSTTYADRNLALLSGTQDATISTFLSYGDMNCANIQGNPGTYPAGYYAAGLADLRDVSTKGDSHFYTYYVDGSGCASMPCPMDDPSNPTRHVWLNDPTGVKSNGVNLTDWINKLIAGDPSLADVPAHM